MSTSTVSGRRRTATERAEHNGDPLAIKKKARATATPEDPTSSYILDMYRVSKYMSYLTDFHFPSAVGNINDISNGLKVYFLLYKVTV
jgi:hypothetical protein